MKSKIKVTLYLLIAVLTLGSFTACSNGAAPTEDVKSTMTMGELAEKILSSVEFSMTMPVDIADVDSMQFISDGTGLSTEWMADASLHVNMIISADTLFLAEAKTPEDVAKIQAAFEKQKEVVTQSFQQYLPEPLVVAEAGQVVTKGNYVMLVMSNNNQAAIDIFNETIQ